MLRIALALAFVATAFGRRTDIFEAELEKEGVEVSRNAIQDLAEDIAEIVKSASLEKEKGDICCWFEGGIGHRCRTPQAPPAVCGHIHGKQGGRAEGCDGC